MTTATAEPTQDVADVAQAIDQQLADRRQNIVQQIVTAKQGGAPLDNATLGAELLDARWSAAEAFGEADKQVERLALIEEWGRLDEYTDRVRETGRKVAKLDGEVKAAEEALATKRAERDQAQARWTVAGNLVTATKQIGQQIKSLAPRERRKAFQRACEHRNEIGRSLRQLAEQTAKVEAFLLSKEKGIKPNWTESTVEGLRSVALRLRGKQNKQSAGVAGGHELDARKIDRSLDEVRRARRRIANLDDQRTATQANYEEAQANVEEARSKLLEP